jgi:hypothetical protein
MKRLLLLFRFPLELNLYEQVVRSRSIEEAYRKKNTSNEHFDNCYYNWVYVAIAERVQNNVPPPTACFRVLCLLAPIMPVTALGSVASLALTW